jgi:hypothetical protein
MKKGKMSDYPASKIQTHVYNMELTDHAKTKLFWVPTALSLLSVWYELPAIILPAASPTRL